MIKEIDCYKGYSESVNWIDGNNRLVGFDLSQQCCESAGYGYFKCDSDIEADNIENGGNGDDYNFFDSPHIVENPDLSDAFFAESQPLAKYGKFKIEGSPNCNWLVLYNFHNGYYHHGFEFKEDGVTVYKDSL